MLLPALSSGGEAAVASLPGMPHIGLHDDALAGDGVDAAVGQGRAHYRQVDGGDQRRALERVDVAGLHRVGVHVSAAEQQLPGRRRAVGTALSGAHPACCQCSSAGR